MCVVLVVCCEYAYGQVCVDRGSSLVRVGRGDVVQEAAGEVTILLCPVLLGLFLVSRRDEIAGEVTILIWPVHCLSRCFVSYERRGIYS